MLIAKINFYDKENNLSLVKAGDEVRAKTKERKDYLLRIGAVIEKDEPKASTSKWVLFICPKRDGLKLSEYADELKRKG